MCKCCNQNPNVEYTLQNMIDEFHLNTENIQDIPIKKWFRNQKSDLMINPYYCNTMCKIIDRKHDEINKSIQHKKQQLSQIIPTNCINEYILHAPLRQLQIIKNFVQCISKMHQKCTLIDNNHESKYCIVCNKYYPTTMLYCPKYYTSSYWVPMTQSMTNFNMCCCFCVGYTYCGVTWQDNMFKITEKLLKQPNKKYLCWWDLQYYMWRYASILKVKNWSILKLNIEITDTDCIAPLQICDIILKKLPNDTFFVVLKSFLKIFTIADNQFELDETNEHIMGWTHFSNAFTPQWQIPVVLNNKGQIPIDFYQICGSVKLFNMLHEANLC